jgi:hypothetical protein
MASRKSKLDVNIKRNKMINTTNFGLKRGQFSKLIKFKYYKLPLQSNANIETQRN